jgi:hypothetical protein
MGASQLRRCRTCFAAWARVAAAIALLGAAPFASSQALRSLVLPLGDGTRWQTLSYRNLPPHRLRFSEAGLEIAVERSAMPLVHPLSAPLSVARIRVQGRFEGELRLPPGRQGDGKFDDYVFRIGLVEPGRRTLNFAQRQLAAPWVRKLFELAPAGSGISGIHFFNVAAEDAHLGRERQHPGSDLIRERVVAVARVQGRFDFMHQLQAPLSTLAVWLSSDGDDTGSSFTVFLERIELQGY